MKYNRSPAILFAETPVAVPILMRSKPKAAGLQQCISGYISGFPGSIGSISSHRPSLLVHLSQVKKVSEGLTQL